MYGLVDNDPINGVDLFGWVHLILICLQEVTGREYLGKVFFIRERFMTTTARGYRSYGQPDLSGFSQGQIVGFENEFNIKTDVRDAIAEMKSRYPKWKPEKGWQWHHFEGGGRRELQYVPAEINNGLSHKVPTRCSPKEGCH